MKMIFLSLLSGCGGLDLGLEKAGFKCVGQIEKMPYALKVLKKHWPKIPKHTDILTFCVQDGLVKVLQSQGKEKDLNIKKQDSGKKWYDVCEYLSQNGFLERMFQGYYPLMKEEIFKKFYLTSWKSGMAYRGEYLIVNSSECPNDAKESSLSDILEESVPPKYYLSIKAVMGILRRTKRRGRSGYVFLLEQEKGKIPQLKRLSLRQLEQVLTQSQIMEHTLSHTQSELAKEEFRRCGKTIILRKLTPTEKEKLQGLPINWTLVEE